MKPPSVVCHHSGWAGTRKRGKLKPGEEPEIPMLQRVRDAIHSLDENVSHSGHDQEGAESSAVCVENSEEALKNNSDSTKRRVNLVHRLDRGASGALLFAFADSVDESNKDNDDVEEDNVLQTLEVDDKEKNRDSNEHQQSTLGRKIKGPTATLIDAMTSPTSTKTYVALVRGEGILNGEDLKEKGWFEVNRPIKDEKGRLNDATTLINFVSGQPYQELDSDDTEDGVVKSQPRISLVLARPQDGRWHQIRRHLNGLSHPILGDTSHGSSKTNREWKEQRNMPGERVCLHLARLQIPATSYTPNGIDCACPLPQDMLDMLKVHAPDVLKEAMPMLVREGILVDYPLNHKYLVGKYVIPAALLKEMNESNKNGVDESRNVSILSQNEHYVVAAKPPGVVVHNSAWNKKRREPTPMLQRVRNVTGKRVNLIHRLDRSASGCLIFAFAEDDKNNNEQSQEVTRTIIESLQNEESTKTYISLVDGDGTWNGVDYIEKGWFNVNLPVKDEHGKVIEAETDIRFIAGTTLPSLEGDEVLEGRKVSIVLARPRTGKYHQIRQHLASGTIGHAIIGDSSHGRSRTNRVWKKKRNLIKERTCLHLMRVQLPPTKFSLDGIDVTCPLSPDLEIILKGMPDLLDKVIPSLQDEGIDLSYLRRSS